MTVISPVRTARIAGSATAGFDLTPHWRERSRGRAGWEHAPALTRELSGLFTATIARAVERAGGLADPAETEIAAATWYGTSHVAEMMHEQLREAGPKWLDPEQFLFYSPHSLVSGAALALGIGGAGSTLMGPDAEFQALTHAMRRIRTGRTAEVIVAEYEALTPFAAVTCVDGPELPDGETLPKGRATALVLRPGGPAPSGREETAERARAFGDVHRGVDAAEVERLARRHAAAVLHAAPGLLRTLAGADGPALVVSRPGGDGRHDAVVVL
ncbi:hypothetical protein KBZ10_01410 [Streptomyces sp. F63]|uniref:hypothetical protein n=1 Tax=Streptomyces sp. F63 TaxID=2824887 RepID=UPI001B36EF0C|nr:hypothetical protein [Streptomyces sp. F63]MBQ0983218.1 hypothetical protein [Streptomyces sp. F63]